MKFNDINIAVLGGAGHVGLPLSMILAKKGFNIKVVDSNEAAIKKIKQGILPFNEDGGFELLNSVLQNNKIEFFTTPNVIQTCNIVIITIGTPIDEHFNPNISIFINAIEKIKTYLTNNQVLILRSTLYPGTTQKIYDTLKKDKLNIGVSYCPERIAQGKAIVELETLPQIIACNDDETLIRVKSLFSKITNKLIILSYEEAELAKLFSNAWRYIKFSVANQFYMMSTETGIDFYKVREAMMEDYSRASDFPKAGFTAGPCLFKDTVQLGAYNKLKFSLGRSAISINETLPNFIVENYKSVGNKIKNQKIGILGMAFKPDCDDNRDSLAYKLRDILELEGAKVMCTDPFISDPDFSPLELVLKLCRVIFIGSPHSIYKEIDFSGVTLIDCWGITR